MRIQTLYALGIVAVSSATAIACSSSSTPPPVVTTNDDAGTDSSTTEPDSGVDTGTVDGANTADGGDAATCVIPAGTDACTTCQIQSCCAEETACDTESADDAGNTDCDLLASCFNDCLEPPADSGVDGGTADACQTACAASHTGQGVADFMALASCQASAPCTSVCGN
jgi:hypothetical protein